MTGIDLMSRERDEQINKHGRTVIRDIAENPRGELVMAAIKLTGRVDGIPWPEYWDPEICKKMDEKTPDEKLVIAGAFLAAELDRRLKLDRTIFGKSKLEEEPFTEAARPLMKFLAETLHPHHTAIVTSTDAELLEGKRSTGKIMDYIKD